MTPVYCKTKPFAHQLKALELDEGKDAFAWFMDMGTGKSKVAIDRAASLYLRGHISGFVITANKGSYQNWEDSQIPTHLHDSVRRRVFTWAAHRLSRISREIVLPFDGLTILVVNVESFISDKACDVAELMLRTHKCLMVVDESTTIKNPKAKRTKAVTWLGKLASYRRIMTGDPISRDPLDLWGQCEFLKAGILGCSSYYAFKARYANMVEIPLTVRGFNKSGEAESYQRSFKKVTSFKNLEQLTELVQKFSYRVKKEECLDLPPKVYEYRYVELTKEQKQYYEQLRDESIAFFSENQFVTGDMVMKRLMKLHQIVCGTVKMDDGSEIALPNNRIGVLMDALEEIDGKAIIWATYRSDIKAIYAAVIKEYGEGSCLLFYGDTPDAERASASDRFQNDQSVRFMLSNASTGGYGNTWTAARYSVYYSNNYRLDERRQSEARNHRIGQEHSVTYVDIVCKGTVDEKIVKSLQDKNKVAHAVMGDEWKEWLV